MARMKVVPAGARIVLGVAALLLAFAVLTSGGDPTGRVAGTVRVAGGTDTDHARAATVSIIDTTRHIQVVRTSSTGRFHVDLAAGDYEVDASTPRIDDGRTPCSKQVPVTVRRGRTTRVDVVCSTR
jgi:hypothetical protein